MPQIYRLDITAENCWKCDHFRRNSNEQGSDLNEGTCTRWAPQGRGGAIYTQDQDLVNCPIAAPQTTVCGEFKPLGYTRQIIEVQE